MQRLAIVVVASFGCQVSNGRNPSGGTAGSTTSSGGTTGSTTGGIVNPGGTGGTSSGGGGGDQDGGVPCPPGLTCNVECAGGMTTTISGTVYDPAGNIPLQNVAVYVPATALVPLPRGVPTGADACSCPALYQSGAVANTVTDIDGKFTLMNAPAGTSVPLVIQVGKWRRVFNLSVNSCQANAQPDKSIKLPGTVAAGNTDDNMPDIAVSTGGADTLECLMLRMGVTAQEYVAGASPAGHVHIFSGGSNSSSGTCTMPGCRPGRPEKATMAGAPSSPTDLWSTQAQLMPYDIVLLSCEGGETYNANPAALEQYLNAGGRAFASHFHYSWFSGPLGSMQSYSAPSDWGNSLATWSFGAPSNNNGAIGGIVDTTLNGSMQAFPKGVILKQWLMNRNALGATGTTVPAGELAIYQPRYNAQVTATNMASQSWITSDSAADSPNMTMYFSFDTPVMQGVDPKYCGRAVFSDLHVAGSPTINDTPNNTGGAPPPAGCDMKPLSPQELALEFMLFDLSSCVIPDNVAPSPPPVK